MISPPSKNLRSLSFCTSLNFPVFAPVLQPNAEQDLNFYGHIVTSFIVASGPAWLLMELGLLWRFPLGGH